MPKGSREKHQVDYRQRTVYPYCHALAARPTERIRTVTQHICTGAGVDHPRRIRFHVKRTTVSGEQSNRLDSTVQHPSSTNPGSEPPNGIPGTEADPCRLAPFGELSLQEPLSHFRRVDVLRTRGQNSRRSMEMDDTAMADRIRPRDASHVSRETRPTATTGRPRI